MITGLRAVLRGLSRLNQGGYLYVWCSVACALLSLLVITAPAAWAGLVRLSWTAQRQPTAGWDDFWAGFRENLVRGALIAVVNVVFWAIWITNWLSYAPAPGIGYAILRGFWLLSALALIMVQLYAGPLYYAMATPTVIGAYRNAAVMLLRNPFFTIGVAFGVAVIAVISVALPFAWALITTGALACVATAAVIDRLRAVGVLPQEEPISYLVDPSYTDM